MPVTLHMNDRGEKVLRLQRALTHMGHAVADDGSFGPDTIAAVKAFQRAHGLPATGIAEPRTIEALALDPETLEDLIVMEDPDADLLRDPDNTIDRYVDALQNQHAQFADSFGDALDIFDRTVDSASTKETRANVLDVVAAKFSESILDDLLGEVAKVVPIVRVVKHVKKALEAGAGEQRRAQEASISVAVRDFSNGYREVLNGLRRRFNQSDARDAVLEDVGEAPDRGSYLRALENLTREINKATQGDERALYLLRLELFEAWINQFFTGIDRSDPNGYAQVIFHTAPGPWKFIQYRLIVPLADKIDDGLKDVARWQHTNSDGPFLRPGFLKQPAIMNLKIHKRVALGADDTAFTSTPFGVGGVADMAFELTQREQWITHAAWFDPNGLLIKEPTNGAAKERLAAKMSGSRSWSPVPGIPPR